ncbi:MAG: Omp28-related outer membrane protein [Bacteroidales bacterium]|nr:Omp28-related outer membrane protein [Bacteroidales bacterium]
MKRNILTVLASVLLLATACTEKPADVPETPSGEVVIPELPKDADPANTSFAHRIVLLQHTGTYCPNCPALMASLKILAEDKSYVDKYHHVAAHSYNDEGDPAYSTAAANLSQAFCSGYYPELTFNLTKENTGTSLSVETIKNCIDELHQETADVGISAAAVFTGNSLGVNVQVKAAKDNQYRVAIWVLEDGIRGKQEGAYEDWMSTHGNAIRAMAGTSLNLRIYGEKVGALSAGQTAEKSFVIEFDESWEKENCKVLVVVNAAQKDGRYDLANCALCPIGGSVNYEYI